MCHITLYIALTAVQSGASVSAQYVFATHDLKCVPSLYVSHISLYIALSAAQSGASVSAKFSFMCTLLDE